MSVRQKRMDAFRRAQQTIQDRNTAARKHAFARHTMAEPEAQIKPKPEVDRE